MNKIIITVMLFFSSLCFADFIDDAEGHYYIEICPQLEKAWVLHSEGHDEESIRYLTSLIDDESISNVDKIHYYFYRSNFFLSMDKTDNQIIDLKKITEMCESDEKCKNEFNFFYNRKEWNL